MKITKISPLTGTPNTMDLDITEEQMREFESPNRRLIQDIFQKLNPSGREFIKTGYTQEDWDTLFPPEEQD